MALPVASTGSSSGISTWFSSSSSRSDKIVDSGSRIFYGRDIESPWILLWNHQIFAHRLLWIGVKILSSEAPGCLMGNYASINIEDSVCHFISRILHRSDNTTELLLLEWKFDLAFLSEVTPVVPYKLPYAGDISMSTMCGNCSSVPIQLKHIRGRNIMDFLPTLWGIIPKSRGKVSTVDVFSNWFLKHTNINIW